MNAYTTVDKLKSVGALSVTTSLADEELRAIVESVSRQIDGVCKRHFYVHTQDRLFDGHYQLVLRLGLDDLISIDSLTTDDDLDRTFETTWASTDYLLYPSNADPATRTNPVSHPYKEIVVDRDAGAKDYFPRGRQSVKVSGRWGYWEHLAPATETMDAIGSTTTTAVTVSNKTDLQVGHTIKVDDEQMYLWEHTGVNGFTVVRGVNGTTAATHSDAAAIEYYEYPETIVQATWMQVSRLFRRAQTGFAAANALEGGGAFPGMDRDVVQMLQFYRQVVAG